VGRGRQGRREGRAWVGTGGMGMGKEGKAGWEEGRRAPKFISAYAPEDVSVTLLSSGITSIVVEGYMPHVLAAL